MKKRGFHFLSVCSLLLVFILLFMSCASADGWNTWDCTHCGQTGNTGKYCSECGSPAPWLQTDTVTPQNITSLQALRQVGSIVKFGRYEQDNNSANGREDIRWVVLDVQEGRSLLLSLYGLDKQPYNSTRADVTWETCTLRQWLNREFLKTAFTEEERNLIETTYVDNSQGQCFSKWSAKGGNTVFDKIFLLSYAEANYYLDVTQQVEDNPKGFAAPTIYAVARGTKSYGEYRTDEGYACACWWLRSPGKYQMSGAEVYADGTLTYFDVNDPQDKAAICVRPALWVDLDGSESGQYYPVVPPAPSYDNVVHPYAWDTQFKPGTVNEGYYNTERYKKLGNIDDNNSQTSFEWVIWSAERTDDIPELTAYFDSATVSRIGIRNGYLKNAAEYYRYARAKALTIVVFDNYGRSYVTTVNLQDYYTTDYQVFPLGGTCQNVSRIEIWLKTYYCDEQEDLNHRYVIHISDIQFYN